MTTYQACFRGRKAGAIGEMSWFNVTIEADSVEEAEPRLYDTHDHVSRLFWLWSGKQTVCEQPKHSLARREKGQTHYVSTYNGETWKQTDCTLDQVERIKAEHLTDRAFMNRYKEVPA